MIEARSGKVSDGTAYFALDQQQGKGQRARAWSSQPGENIILSVVKSCTSLQLQEQFQLSCAVALACFDLFSAYAGEETRIKWPNDIFWRDRKAGGILIENIIKTDKWDKAIIGMGININQTVFEGMEKKAVSLKQITGKTFDPISLAKELCGHLDKRFDQLQQESFDHLLSLFNQHLYKRGETVQFKKQESPFHAKVDGVNEKGHLLITHGFQEALTLGDVTWIL
jgi:BirA family biotin operon repressor/biotin-[acetyl-CoA-carboxylase] ligase